MGAEDGDGRLEDDGLADPYKILYRGSVPDRSEIVVFMGSAPDDLRASPSAAPREARHQIDRVQAGFDPDDWKPTTSIGSGVREIRVREASGAFRVIYAATIADAVVLHCFRKTTQKTRREDLALAKRRYGDAIRGGSS